MILIRKLQCLINLIHKKIFRWTYADQNQLHLTVCVDFVYCAALINRSLRFSIGFSTRSFSLVNNERISTKSKRFAAPLAVETSGQNHARRKVWWWLALLLCVAKFVFTTTILERWNCKQKLVHVLLKEHN